MIDEVFKNKTANLKKLEAFGFKKAGGIYSYSTDIMAGQFSLQVALAEKMQAVLIDKDSGEPYILHLTNAEGAFVGKIRAECQAVLSQIAESCFETEVFHNEQTRAAIGYIREKYGDEPEFLWEKFPDNAIVRRKDNKKWYVAILTVSAQKIGRAEAETAEIIDLRGYPDEIALAIDNQKYYPAYHMNKKHWYTICLDESVSMAELFKWIDDSFLLAQKK